MKLILENWRRLLEGDVIQFPRQPRISEEDIQFVIDIEYQIANRLEALHDNTSEIPVEKLERLDGIMNEIEELLKA